jgi:hypothetical protein
VRRSLPSSTTKTSTLCNARLLFGNPCVFFCLYTLLIGDAGLFVGCIPRLEFSLPALAGQKYCKPENRNPRPKKSQAAALLTDILPKYFVEALSSDRS